MIAFSELYGVLLDDSFTLDDNSFFTVKDALTGATYQDNGECITLGGDPHYLYIEDLDAHEVDKIDCAPDGVTIWIY